MYLEQRTKEVTDDIEHLLKMQSKYISGSHYDYLHKYVVRERKRFFAYMVLMGVSREACRSLLTEIQSGEDSDLSPDDIKAIKDIIRPDTWETNQNSKNFDYGTLKGPHDRPKMKGFCRLFTRGAEKLSSRIIDMYPFLMTCQTKYVRDTLNWPRLSIERIVAQALKGEHSRERGDRLQRDVVKTLQDFNIAVAENHPIKSHTWDCVYEDANALVLVEMTDMISTASGVTHKMRRLFADIKDVKSTRKSKEIIAVHVGMGAGFKRRSSDLRSMKDHFDHVFKYNPDGVADLIQFLQRDVLDVPVTPHANIVSHVLETGRL